MIKILNYYELGENFFDYSAARSDAETERIVSEIISEVRRRGDEAVLDFTERFDSVRLDSLAVNESEFEAAEKKVSPRLVAVMRAAAENIRDYHSQQIEEGFSIKRDAGVILGQRVTAIEKAGIYVPNGTASYPSTVLMDAIPAKLAGVSDIIMTTPPRRDGKIAPEILVAAHIAGIDRIFKCGGAQAIAALAYGTESIPRVYKIVGPGNIFAATAKRMVFGQVDIDMIAGPSDILIIADLSAKSELIAADMLAQAEHDKLSRAILVTPSQELAIRVSTAIERRLIKLPRAEIARAAIDGGSSIIITKNLEECAECANRVAPEHLELMTTYPWELFSKIKNAGSVFIGEHSPEALGDYFAGVNHTLPTMGTARFSGPLSVSDFTKRSSYTFYSEAALRRDGDKIKIFARSEGLDAHAESILARQDTQ